MVINTDNRHICKLPSQVTSGNTHAVIDNMAGDGRGLEGVKEKPTFLDYRVLLYCISCVKNLPFKEILRELVGVKTGNVVLT